ncbi:MAG: carbon-nitrogen family hydrolase [Planctomycetes bacterium]|nr:carbon-nitrogen family hydrolase [Planctomycetota bacterium]
MRIAAIQFESRGELKSAAVERALGLLDQARGSELVLLPELWPTGFFSVDRFAQDAEPLDGPTVRLLRDRTAALKCHLFTGSFVERDGARLFNTSLLLDRSGAIMARYRKIHLFGHGGSEEPAHLSPGREITVVDTPWGRTGLSTCYDLRFPELYRRMLDQGAQVFLIAAAWPLARLESWQLFLRARAAENQALVLACNGAGVSEGRALAGHSQFVDVIGKPLATAGEREEMLMGEIDPSAVAKTRSEFNVQRDRVFHVAAEPARGSLTAERSAMSSQASATTNESGFDVSTLRRFTDGAPYLGEFETGLYPGASNRIPEAHQAAGIRIAASLRPLDKDGRSDPESGKIAALVLGHSNCNQYFNAVGRILDEKRSELNNAFVLLNAAIGGQQLPQIVELKGKVWDRTNDLLAQQNLATSQIQALFLHTTWVGASNRDKQPPGAFPAEMQTMQRAMVTVLAHCVKLFPNLKLAYLTCDGLRHYTNFEPHVWREAFALKWLIASQIRGEKGTAFEGPERVLPWLQWGPYHWDNHWDETYFTDGVHPAPHAERIFASKYFKFLKNDPVARGWLVRA